MRLIYITNDGHFRLKEYDTLHEEIPPYAILSHSWGPQETLRRYLNSLNGFGSSFGEPKNLGKIIRFCAEQAKGDDLYHFWIDAWCIDRRDEMKLGEAESILEHFKNAKKCFIILSDFESSSLEHDGESDLRKRKWFTRGWTLQELLAPHSVEFFSQNGVRLGDKESLKNIIHDITGIPVKTLIGADLSGFDVTDFVSWMKYRQTMSTEDVLYYLLENSTSPIMLGNEENRKQALGLLKRAMHEEMLRKIYRWLSPPDPSTDYHKGLDRRLPGTGFEFLDRKEFKEWKESVRSSRLWLFGAPESGKTILSSTIINHLQQYCHHDRSMATVYFYFKKGEFWKQNSHQMLRSLLYQLLQRSVVIPEHVYALYSSCQNGQKEPSIHALLQATQQTVQDFAQVYIVLDALDEHVYYSALPLNVVQEVVCWQLDNLHLLATSRTTPGLSGALGHHFKEERFLFIHRGILESDMRRYIQQRLRSVEFSACDGDADLLQEIENTLMNDADGSFDTVVMQLDILKAYRGQATMRQIFTTLPPTLDEIHDYSFSPINKAAEATGNAHVANHFRKPVAVTTKLKIEPSDSGYASQRQVDSLYSQSIPDPGFQSALQPEDDSVIQVPSHCDEEAYADDIRSIDSDHESIGSNISTDRSKAELFAIRYIASFFAQRVELRSLHETALQKIDSKRFVRNYRRILKSYYRRLLGEAANDTEKEVTYILRSRRNRQRIAEEIANHHDFEEEEKGSLDDLLAQPAEKQYLEDWLKRTPGMDYGPLSETNQEPVSDNFQSENNDSDSEIDIDSEAEADNDFSNIHRAEIFLQRGSAFHNLVLDIRLLMLPYHLRHVIETTPRSSLKLILNDEKGCFNSAKLFVESYTGSEWDWWPLAPRIPRLGNGEQHLEWKLGRRKVYVRVLQEQTDAIREILKIPIEHPPKCRCCVAKPPKAPRMTLTRVFMPALNLLGGSRQRSAVSGSSSSRAAMAYTPTPNNTSGVSSSTISSSSVGASVSGVVPQNIGSNNSTQTQRCSPIVPSPILPKAPTRIIFGIQGLRKSLEIEQIMVSNQMNDQTFFPELRNRYKKHRLSLLRWLSPFQFRHCDFVRFRKVGVNRVFFSCEGLPEEKTFANDYEYDPKPPQGKIPLIEPDLFAACLESCDEDCMWSIFSPWLHDCFQLEPSYERITCIPKKKSEFAVQSKHGMENFAWGIQPGYAVSFCIFSIYALVPLLSAFGFWVYWLRRHPGDWQNASVPMVTAVTLETLLVSLLVLSPKPHLSNRRR